MRIHLPLLAAMVLGPAALTAQPTTRPAELPLDVPEARWTEVIVIESGTFSVDLEGMKTEGSQRLVWERLVLSEPLEDTGVDRVYVYARFDCAGSRRATLYAVRTAAGRIVSEEAQAGDLRPVGPPGQRMLNAICGRR